MGKTEKKIRKTEKEIKKTGAQQDKKREEKRKPKYKGFFCIKWLLKTAWEWDKKMLIAMLLFILFSVAGYALSLYIPSIILDRLKTSESFQTVALAITALLGAQLMFQLLKNVAQSYGDYSQIKQENYTYWLFMNKQFRDDYQLGFDEQYTLLCNRAGRIVYNGRFIAIFRDFANVIVNIACFFLFGTVISMLSPWIMVLLAAGGLVSYLMKRRVAEQNNSDRKLRDENDKKLGYYSGILPQEYHFGKDIRVFGYVDYIESRWNLDIREHIRLERIVQNRWSLVQLSVYLIDFLRDGTAYLYLIRNAAGGGITPAQFVLYFSAISQMSRFMSGIFDYFSALHETVLQISDWIEFLCEERGRCNHGEGIPVPKNRAVSLELRNVSFGYPGEERNVLEHINMKIEAGENVSLVGLNGAGKTTLTLLMCGLFLPDEGEVLIDGHPVQEYNRDELYGLFSVVPQKYSVMPTSIAENIGMCHREEIDDQKMWECLEKVGLSEKIRG